MTEILKESKPNITLDISQYDTFRMCEMKYYLRHILLREPLEKAAALDRGSLVHLACEVYYTKLKLGTPYQDAVVFALSSVRTAGTTESSLDVDDVLKVIDTMEQYFDYWRVADQNIQIVEVEKPFIYLLHEAEHYRLYMSGKIDLIITDNKYTNLPWDHKSFDRTFETTRMSNQFKNYANALNSNFLIVNKIGMQKTLKPHEKFLRVPLSFDHLYLEQWKKNVINCIDHFVNCLAEGYWPQNETSCFKFNRKCEYHDVCDSSGEAARQYKLYTMYSNGEKWDVTKSLRKTSELLLTEEKS